MPVNRLIRTHRCRVLASAVVAGIWPIVGRAAAPAGRYLLFRASWQTENSGDIAHTPGTLALLEKHRPHDRMTLWPKRISPAVEQLLMKRFLRRAIARTKEEQEAALAACDFFLHGSGPELVGRNEAERARIAGKPYGFGGIALSDAELRDNLRLLPGKAFFRLRDDEAATALLKRFKVEAGGFLCVVPRLHRTPYWEIRPEEANLNATRIAENEAFVKRDNAKLREAIVAIASGTPAVHLRQPTNTRKGKMWREIGLDAWLFEIDDSAGRQITESFVEIGTNLPAARRTAARARTLAAEKMVAMAALIA